MDDDPVNHPAHYTQGNIEVIDFIADQQLNFLEGCIVKYVTRYKHRWSGCFSEQVKDLKKARFYLDRLITEVDSKGCAR